MRFRVSTLESVREQHAILQWLPRIVDEKRDFCGESRIFALSQPMAPTPELPGYDVREGGRLIEHNHPLMTKHMRMDAVILNAATAAKSIAPETAPSRPAATR